ncbi:MAG: hypothetical protein IPN06_09955 [Burkholderiales bacterium]|nr:hypothetical protein [Burkholderiales bacterium]
MQNLEKRIATLETTNPPAEELTIIRRIVCPGHLEAEINHIRDDGSEWTRQPGETEDAFIERADSDTPPNKHGIKRLIASNMELHRADH